MEEIIIVFVRQSRWQRRKKEILTLIATRILIMMPMIVVVSLGVFLLAEYSPFDPLVAYLGDNYERTTNAQRHSLEEVLGFDQSWWSAWQTWSFGVLHGDLGYSRVYAQPVRSVLMERLPWTLLLSTSAFVVAIIISFVVGVIAGMAPGRLLDRSIAKFAMLVQAIPPFVLSLGAISLFAVMLQWLPAGGATAPRDSEGGMVNLLHLVLPVTVLALSQLPWLILSLRISVQQALASDAIRCAIARGIRRETVVMKHILPVSLAPLVTVIGARLPELLVGAVIVEEIFGWPGIASSMVLAARELDFSLLAFLTIATTTLVFLGSMIADAIYLLLDPRVQQRD